MVGTGSVGLRDYVVYMEGNGSDDPLFLQIKEEPNSAYAPYLGEMGAPQHQGHRVVQGQRSMQFQSDLLLGWTTINNRHYLVRQLNDHKASIAIEDLKGEGLNQYAEICGELLARGHARAGDAIALSGYIGTSDRFIEAIAEFAVDYADQTEVDYKEFMRSRFAPHTAGKKALAKKAAVKHKPRRKTAGDRGIGSSGMRTTSKWLVRGDWILIERTAGPSASPDFLLILLALTDFMRFSPTENRTRGLSSAAWQEIRVRSG